MIAPLIIECSPEVMKMIDALLATGMWGSSRDIVAQRLLEMMIFEIAMMSNQTKLK